MAESDTERRNPRPVLLVGAGRRTRQVSATLAALSSIAPEGDGRLEPYPEFGVADLEELLAQRPVEGLLILEAGRVPAEDIGFVRRFLERHPGWRLLVIGEEKPEARALLTLPRASWLAWPPDMEALDALLLAPAASPPGEERGARRAARRPPTVSNGAVDVGGLLEELLAGAALHGESTPRFHFRQGEPCLVHFERALLLEGLGGLVELARLCAGPGGVVRAALEPGADGVRMGLEFPRAGLPEKNLPELFEHPSAGLEPDLAQGLLGARRGVEVLREIGARIELSAAKEEGRVRCEVRLALRPPMPRRGAKPEDPFA